jgi:hypothetical protein
MRRVVYSRVLGSSGVDVYVIAPFGQRGAICDPPVRERNILRPSREIPTKRRRCCSVEFNERPGDRRHQAQAGCQHDTHADRYAKRLMLDEREKLVLHGAHL